MKKIRYALVGTGNRATMYVKAVCLTYRDRAELVGICDINPGRMEYYNREFLKVDCEGYPDVPMFTADRFDEMIAVTKPDVVIVTSMDRTHHIYGCRAMELGCDVISEKPMTVDAEKCQQIIDTQKATGRNYRVTFNYRYAPRNTEVKRLLKEGIVGEVTTVNFEWLLDTSHGADYFRRWHRNKANTGGLLVHKSTHHFDLVNWWLDSTPASVFAMGDLKFYGRANAERRGVTQFYQRAYGSELAAKDPFAYKMSPRDVKLYLDNEKYDGYQRDQSVFGDGISIEDNMSVMVRYRNNVVMNYTLCAHCPWEGYRVSFNGTEGRLEFNVVEKPVTKAGEDMSVFGMREEDRTAGDKPEIPQIIVQKHWMAPRKYDIVKGQGAHGGGDVNLLGHLFGGVTEDPLGHAADFRAGANSIIVGIAGNESMRTGRLVKVDDLIHF